MSFQDPISSYLRSSPITYISTVAYDGKGRQLPFHESPTQKKERLAFVQSLRWQRTVSTWMDHQMASTSTRVTSNPSVSTPRTSSSSSSSLSSSSSPSLSPNTHSTTSSESSSPRTPSSPKNTPHTHTPQQSLDIQLTKSFDKLATTVASPVSPHITTTSLPARSVQHNRNYKNLHLAQPLSRITHTRAQTRAEPRVSSQTHTLSSRILDSSPYTPSPIYSYPYPPQHGNNELDAAEPYIFYSSSTSSDLTREPRRVTASIGEFPTPKTSTPASSSPSRTLTISSVPRP